MSREIVFDHIDLEDPAYQAAKFQVTTTCKILENGKKIYIKEETDWMYHKYSSFKPAKWYEDNQRNSLQIPVIGEAELKMQSTVGEYYTALDKKKEVIFGKYAPLYYTVENIKPPEQDEDGKMKISKFNLELDKSWNYYYDGKKLDENNSSIVKKTFLEMKNKDALNNLNLTLTFNEDGKEIKKSIKYSDIETRHEFSTKVYYRKIPNKEKIDEALINKNYEKLRFCSEQDIIKHFGEPVLMDVRTPTDLDKYYTKNCFVRLIYAPRKVWATKNKDFEFKGKKMRRCGIKFICKEIDIIQIENPYDALDGTIKNKYIYGFTGKSSQPIASNSDNEDNEDEDDDNEPALESVIVEKGNTKSSKSIKVDSVEEDDDDDDEDEDEDTKIAVESDSDESEPEPEPKMKQNKSKKSSKVIESESEDDSEPEPEPVQSKKSSKIELKSNKKVEVDTKPTKTTKKSK